MGCTVCHTEVEFIFGTKVVSYYVNGKLNDNGNKPAVTKFYPNGDVHRYHYHNGELHRDNGPAIIKCMGGSTYEYYYRNNKMHRDNGPASVAHFQNGLTIEYYYQNGEIRNGNQPGLVINSDGYRYSSYYLDGQPNHSELTSNQN